MRSRRAIPWFEDVECCGKRQPVDMNIEQVGTGKLPEKYERELIEYFGTDDKRKMLQKALRSRRVPVYCQKCRTVEIVDSETGDMVKRVASKILRELLQGHDK